MWGTTAVLQLQQGELGSGNACAAPHTGERNFSNQASRYISRTRDQGGGQETNPRYLNGKDKHGTGALLGLVQ